MSASTQIWPFINGTKKDKEAITDFLKVLEQKEEAEEVTSLDKYRIKKANSKIIELIRGLKND